MVIEKKVSTFKVSRSWKQKGSPMAIKQGGGEGKKALMAWPLVEELFLRHPLYLHVFCVEFFLFEITIGTYFSFWLSDGKKKEKLMCG